MNWELVEKLPYVIGDFSWTAWDYLGEAGIGKITYDKNPGMSFYAPYPCKAAYCGDMNPLWGQASGFPLAGDYLGPWKRAPSDRAAAKIS